MRVPFAKTRDHGAKANALKVVHMPPVVAITRVRDKLPETPAVPPDSIILLKSLFKIKPLAFRGEKDGITTQN